MAITTDSYVTINGHSVGLSKVISQVTLADVEDVIYSGYLDDKRNCNMLPAGQNIPLPRLASTSDSDSTVKVIHIGENYCVTESSVLEGQLYFRNVLVYVDNGYNFGGSVIMFPDTYNAGHIHFITDIDIQELEMVCNSDVNVQHTAGMKYYGSDVTYGSICVAQVIKDSNDKFIIATLGGYNCDDYTRFNSPILYQPSYDMYYFRRYNYPSAGYLNIDKSSRWCFEPNLRYSLSPCTFDGTSYQAPESLAKVTLTYWGGTNFFDIIMNDPDSANYIYYAWGGLRFTDGTKHYKPIVEDGYITGYTDDDSVTSEFDEWENISDHTTPATPPSPVPPGPTPGYDDDPWSGASFSGVGVGGAGAFAKCYYMTSTELANLRSWMNSINVPEGFDPMQQIIGLSQVPVALSGSGPENVVFVNSSAVYDPGVTTRAVDTGVATQQAMGTPISYYLGSVDIVRRMQERGEPYLDYDCQIELYLPLIGMFSLDTQAVMGRTISAYAVLDPVSGTLAAYAYVTKDGQNLPVAYGSTTIGVDLPISAQQLSVSRAALKQANAQLGASLLSGALTMLAAASSSGKSSGSGAKTSTGSSGLSAAGIREAGSDYMKASQVGNVFGDFMNWGRTIRQLSYGNNTAIAGSFGGSTAQWAYPFTPYVKIIRPRFEKPSNYAHSQGVPCVQTKTVGSCTGFIQCIGVDVSGISGATDLELQAIQAALSNGIYAGGGQ